jgi:hypothetical protein
MLRNEEKTKKTLKIVIEFYVIQRKILCFLTGEYSTSTSLKFLRAGLCLGYGKILKFKSKL